MTPTPNFVRRFFCNRKYQSSHGYRRVVHPIEQLRYVARASGSDASLLVSEAASALGMFRDDRNALLAGCRSLLARQPGVGPLWWMCSQLLADHDVASAVRMVVREIELDPTPRDLSESLPSSATVVVAGWPDSVVRALAIRADVRVLVVDVDDQARALVRRLERSDVDAEAVEPSHFAGAVEAANVVLVEAGAMGSSECLTDVGGMTLAALAKVSSTPCWLVAGVGRLLPEVYFTEIIERVSDDRIPSFVAEFEVVSRTMFSRTISAHADCPVLPELLNSRR